jgi:hypothetical protein
MGPFRSFQIMRQKFGELRLTASAFGAYAGLLGMEHGFFETLQGNVVPHGMRIRASLSELPFPFGHEPAMTIIPNFLVTGIFAMIVGLSIVVWATAYIQKKGGGVVLFLLSVVLLLVGGGFGAITLLLTASFAAAGINKTLPWWRSHLSVNLVRFLAKAWWWCFIAALLWVPAEFAVGYLFGVKNDPRQNLTNLNLILSYPMLGLFLLTLLTGFSCEIARRSHLHESA